MERNIKNVLLIIGPALRKDGQLCNSLHGCTHSHIHNLIIDNKHKADPADEGALCKIGPLQFYSIPT